MSGWTLHPVGSFWLVAGAGVVLVLLLFVRPTQVRLSRRQQLTLAALRLLVVLLALFAMLRPTYVYTETRPQRTSLVLLLDASRSMQVADSLGNASRWDTVRALLDESSAELAELADKLDVRVFLFDEDIRPAAWKDRQLDLPETVDGSQTALGAAIDDLLAQETGGRLTAVLLLSDGAQRAVPPRDLSPQVAARRMRSENIPLYTFAFGRPGGSDRADLQIGDLAIPESVFSAAPTEVRGTLRAEGYANQLVKVQLLCEEESGEMQVVDSVELTTGPTGEPIPITLRHTPQSPGERKVTLRVEPRESELVTSNNETSTFVTVREGGIRVLYLVGAARIGGSAPGLEQRFVRDALAASPDIAIERRLFDYRQPRRDLRELLAVDAFDVVFLDDVDALALDEASWAALVEMVRAGAGLMVLGGYHSYGPGGYRSIPLADVLPLEIGPAERQNFGEPIRQDVHLSRSVKLRPTAPIGTQHPVMQIGGEKSRDVWQQLPPLDGANLFERRKLRPNAIVLAESDDAERHPLIVAGQPGTGRVLASAVDSTWRWRMAGFADAHRRFWRQCVLWLAKKDDTTGERVWIRLAQRQVTRGSRVDFQVGVRDDEGSAEETATVEAQIRTPEGTVVPAQLMRQEDGWIASFRETQVPGDYLIEATARRGQDTIGAHEARFLVPDQDLELDQPAAEPGLLAQLAETTEPAGGQALAPEELPALLARLAGRPPEVKEEILARVTHWDTWPFFLLFVALLGVEWYLRKSWGLV